MGQGSALSRRGFLRTGIKLGAGASAASVPLSGCERSIGRPQGGFVGPDFASGHRLRIGSSPEGQVIQRQAKIVILGGGIA